MKLKEGYTIRDLVEAFHSEAKLLSSNFGIRTLTLTGTEECVSISHHGLTVEDMVYLVHSLVKQNPEALSTALEIAEEIKDFVPDNTTIH